MSRNAIDTSVLDNIIYGRVEPYIYAFTTETIPNYLKVGDTYRPVKVRLKEWKTYFPNLQQTFEHIAKTTDDRIFRDYSVHQFIEIERHRKRLTKELFPEQYYSNEFFENAKNEDVEDAIADILADAENNSGKYRFYDANYNTQEYTYERIENFKPRENQDKVIERFKNAVNSGGKKLLMYAVMRFGKSFTSMCCATEINAKVVVVVSAKGDVESEWKKTVESHERFTDYVFATKECLKKDTEYISKTLKLGKRIVLFLTLQYLQGNEIKEECEELFKTDIDLLLVDESHFGARASEYGKVLQTFNLKKNQLERQLKKELQDEYTIDQFYENNNFKILKANVTMHLSGTPYRILMSDEFAEDDIVAFYQYSDIADDLAKWDADHKEDIEQKVINPDTGKPYQDWDNPYYGFPQMIRFAFSISENIRNKINLLKDNGVSYAFSELFRPCSIEKDTKTSKHKHFVHKQEVLDLLEIIDGSKNDENVLGFLDYDRIKNGEMCQHVVFVLPFRASCDAMETLLNDNKNKFKNLCSYQIINIAGVDDEKTYEKTENVKSKIKKCEEQGLKTITLTVNKMLTGSTVEQWDTMVFLKDTASPQEYDQAIFRLQNQYIKKFVDDKGNVVKFNMKPQTLLVDFDIDRMFRMQEQKSQIYNVNTCKNGNSELQARIEKELRISPIIMLNSKKMQEVEATNIMDAVREYSSSKSVADEAIDIPTDYTLLANEKIRAAIENLAAIDAKKGIEIKSHSSDGDDDYEVPEDTNNTNEREIAYNYQSSSGNESTDEAKELAKKLATYYSQILFYAFLTDNKVSTLTDIIADIEKSDANQRICRNVGLSKNILIATQKYSNPFVLSKLDYKIQNINTLIRDKDLEPINRVETAMRKFGRLGTAEIVTPTGVADKIVAILPKDYATRQVKILDIASKQGEFTTALYRKFGDNVKKSIYALPTSPITYEFTLKVYKLLGMPTKNVIADFTCFDLINENKDKYIKQLLNMNFDAIVGNPPYQATLDNKRGLAKQLFPEFIKTATQLKATYVSLITPLRWFTAEAQDGSFIKLRNYFKDNHHFQKIFSYPNTADMFNEEIAGGVNYFLYSDLYDGDTEFHVIIDGKDSVSTRPLFEDGIDIVIYDQKIYRIIEHLKKVGFTPVSDITTGRDAFGIVGTKEIVKKNSYANHFDGSIELRCAHEEIRYISREKISKSKEFIDKWKVFTSKANGGAGILGDGKPVAIIGKAYIGKPNSVCTDSLLPFGCFSTEQEAVNLQKYMKTKFFRFCVGILKTSQNLCQIVYQFVPLQDFTAKSDIDWNKPVAKIDEQLYEKYGLSGEEQAFIEGMIKDME